MLTDSFGEVRMSLLLENSEGVKNMGSYRLGVISAVERRVRPIIVCRRKKRQTDYSEFQ